MAFDFLLPAGHARSNFPADVDRLAVTKGLPQSLHSRRAGVARARRHGRNCDVLGGRVEEKRRRKDVCLNRGSIMSCFSSQLRPVEFADVPGSRGLSEA